MPYLEAFDVIFHVSLVEVVDEVLASLIAIFLEPLLQSIKHNTTQLLNIMLLPSYTCTHGENPL